jgi:hypothetical protein
VYKDKLQKQNILIDVRKNQADKLKFFLKFELVNEKKGKDRER